MSSLLSAILLASALLNPIVSAATINAPWFIENIVQAPDGFARSISTVNADLPGPILRGKKGDSFLVSVTNRLTDPSMRMSVTFHWHGILMKGNGENDGPAFVTQCPIAPNNAYTYEIPVGDQVGTYWYHSHLSTQYGDGLYGAMIIEDPEDPNLALYDVDDNAHIIALSQYFHTSVKVLTDAMNAGGPDPAPDSNLINGVGRYINGPEVPRAVISVEQGLRYRFRVINMGTGPSFTFSIEGHRLTVIEADGISVVPLTVDSIEIAVGQRYSVVVEANQTVGNYWIRAPASGTGTANFNASENFAILRYDGASDEEPTTPKGVASGSNLPANTVALVPFENPGAPGGSGPADQVFNLTISRATVNGVAAWEINGIQYLPPTVPTLLQILSMGFNSSFNVSEHTIPLPPNQIIEVNVASAAHPLHLHGHSFDVISAGGSPKNYATSTRRDVIPATGGLTLRFKTDNPGPWFFHCHIEPHLERGLALVFAEDTNTEKTLITPDQDWFNLCPTYNALPPEQQ